MLLQGDFREGSEFDPQRDYDFFSSLFFFGWGRRRAFGRVCSSIKSPFGRRVAESAGPL